MLAAGRQKSLEAATTVSSLPKSENVMTTVLVSSISWHNSTSPPPFAFLEKWKPSLSTRHSVSIWGRSETKIQRGEMTESI